MSDELDATKDDYRMEAIKSAEKQLEDELLKYNPILKRYNRLKKVIDILIGVFSALNIICTTGALSTALSGVGIIACIPLSSLAVINTFTLAGLTLLSRRIVQKKKKHESTIRLVRTHKSKIVNFTSQALDDGDIDAEEFCKIVQCVRFYYDEKHQLRKSLSENLNAHAS